MRDHNSCFMARVQNVTSKSIIKNPPLFEAPYFFLGGGFLFRSNYNA